MYDSDVNMIINFIKVKFYLKNLTKKPFKIFLIFNLKILIAESGVFFLDRPP